MADGLGISAGKYTSILHTTVWLLDIVYYIQH